MLWVAVPGSRADEAEASFPRLGYVDAVDLLVPAVPSRRAGRHPHRELVRWRGDWHRLRPVYREEEHASTALERRTFLLETAPGTFREVFASAPLAHVWQLRYAITHTFRSSSSAGSSSPASHSGTEGPFERSILAAARTGSASTQEPAG